MADNIREIVLDTLLEMERSRVYSNQAVKAALDKYDYLDSQDKRFIKRLAEGCVERRIELDYLLDQFSSVPVSGMKPLIRCLLRMGVYQILYMDGVPHSAACNEAVKLAGKRKFTNLKGFVNGVLRKIASRKDSLPLPDPEAEPLLYLSVRYSMPQWIVEMWLAEYGREQTRELLEQLLTVHPVTIRFTRGVTEEQRRNYLLKWQQRGVQVTRSEYLDYAYYLEGVLGVTALEGYEEGAFMVQDVSSMRCVEAAGLKEETGSWMCAPLPAEKPCWRRRKSPMYWPGTFRSTSWTESGKTPAVLEWKKSWNWNCGTPAGRIPTRRAARMRFLWTCPVPAWGFWAKKGILNTM